MRVELTGGLQALIRVQYGEEVFSHEAPVNKALDKVLTHYGFCIDVPPSRTTTVTISVLDKNGVELGQREGKATCSPSEQFQRFQGRRWAMRRAFDHDTQQGRLRLLSYEDRKRIARALLPKLARRVKLAITRPGEEQVLFLAKTNDEVNRWFADHLVADQLGCRQYEVHPVYMAFERRQRVPKNTENTEKTE